MYKVYVKLADNNTLEAIDSTAYYTSDYLLSQGYVYLDEGEDTEIYGLAQLNYLLIKYNKTLYDENYLPNFKYINHQIQLLTDSEKQALLPKTEPLEQDKINADLYLQIASLQAQTGTPITISTLSSRYEQIKKYYDLGLYTEEDLNLFVQVGWISEEEKQQIIQSI